jgi:hypothetical protein
MTTNPNSNLATASQPWGRDVEKRLKDLENSINRLNVNSNSNITQMNSLLNNAALSVSRLNGAANSLTDIKVYEGGDPERPLIGSSKVATVNFQRPSWANTATVIAIGSISGSGSVSDPLSGSVKIDIDGSRPLFPAGSTYAGMEYNRYILSADSKWFDIGMQYTKTFNFVGDTFPVSIVFEKNTNGAGASYYAYITASVYWTIS